MRLIDADELREGWLEWDPYDTIEANTVLYSIDDQPTINPEDLRPEGRWEAYPNELYLRCSVCRKEFYIGHFPLTKKYCPNCGAKMEE